jgi:hypothetical protein
MHDQELIAKVVAQIEEMKGRVAEQSVRVDKLTGDEMFEEVAILRNLVMQLGGLQLILLQHERRMQSRYRIDDSPTEEPDAT